MKYFILWSFIIHLHTQHWKCKTVILTANKYQKGLYAFIIYLLATGTLNLVAQKP